MEKSAKQKAREKGMKSLLAMPYGLAVFGRTGVGKSTFANTLLGDATCKTFTIGKKAKSVT